MQGLELILILLAVAAGLRLAADRFSVPFPTLLVLGGLVLAVMPGLPSVELNPDVVFFIFVPPLLYWAALTTSYRDFRRNLRSISLLGVGLVLMTMSVTAWVAHTLIPELTWAAAFTLGAIVSPPDAVAVTSITRRLGVPRVVVTILDGEGLLNDATAFVAYRMAVAAVVAGTFSIWEASSRFVWTAAGGIALGLTIGWLIGRLRRLIGRASVVENTISLLTPFAVFIPAERLGLASVLAVVAAGLYLGRKGPRFVSADTRLQAQAMWEMLVFILEGLIFIIIGLELPLVRRAIVGHSLPTLLLDAALISAVLIAVRIIWVFPGTYLPRFVRRKMGKRDSYPPWRQVFFVGWAGIRGGDSLVIALALPLVTNTGTPFPGRDLIIILTFAIILVTLVLQGFTLTPILRLLKLHGDDEDEQEEAAARLKTAQVGLQSLSEMAVKDSADSTVIENLREKYEHRVHKLSTTNQDGEAKRDQEKAKAYNRIRRRMIAAEREEVIRLRDEDEISDDVMRTIQQDLDLEEVLLSDSEWADAPRQEDDEATKDIPEKDSVDAQGK
ncbi:MAG: Na+/H+ antiporter [Acidobacteria bacterium]|nr:MAG: Na+/H+ antiporter [Acidobacteriota bacterium]PYS85090.1 MAG: Na+/H+ antiporter [Acidobacteriota bacterium]